MSLPRIARTALAATALAVGAAASAAHAAPAERLRVYYGEAVEIAGLDARAAAYAAGAETPRAAGAPPIVARFDAYGRRFELALESNARLVPSLAADATAPQLWRGTLDGLPGSWVRLTVSGARRWGLIWDGHDLYVLEPAAEAAANFVGPAPATGSATVVFRLSDTQVPEGTSQCGAVRVGDAATGLDAYANLLAELRAASGAATGGPAADGTLAPPTAAATATRRLQVSVLGDYEYVQRFGGTTGRDRVLSLFNNVDGIFASQVGVQLEVVSATMLTTPATSPFTATKASDRLTELSTYRRARSALTATGVTHLVTGVDVTSTDGSRSTVGIAYIGSLCSSSFGASLSEASNSASLDSLVMAHELGHNFGAEHDGETGSVCASTPTTFLMAPTLNRSDQFSQCSLDTIARDVARASCLLPATTSTIDLSVGAGAAPSAVLAGRSFVVGASVANVGNAAAADARLQFTLPSGLEFQQASAGGGGTCGPAAAGGVDCTWTTFPAGSNASVELTLRGGAVGSYTIAATASAAGDVSSANDAASWSVRVDPLPDVALELPLATAATAVGQDVNLVANVRNAGSAAATNVQVTVAVPAVIAVQSVAPADACAASGATVTCSFPTLAAGETRSVTLAARGAQAGTGGVQYSLNSADDGTPGNNSVSLSVTVTEAATPPPTPPPTTPPTTPATSGGGGGGGGALGLPGLLAFAALAALRRRAGAGVSRRAAAGRC